MRNLFFLFIVSTISLTACLPELESDTETNTGICEVGEICQMWLDTHNNFRAELNAGTVVDDGTYGTYPIPKNPLPDLTWNEQLAEVAQAHADACVYEHNGERREDYVAAGGENIYIGENIAYNATNGTLAALVTYAEAQTKAWWNNENHLWHYQPYQSGTINGAGHFSQMIWANTIEIGCGIASCPDMNPGYDTAFGVCNYGPGGNYIGQHPY